MVQVVYDPTIISTEAVLDEFWSGNRPTMPSPPNTHDSDAAEGDHNVDAARDQASDQYRSILLATTEEQLRLALDRRAAMDAELEGQGRRIATQIRMLDEFFYAEDYHQQYAAKRSPQVHCR